MYDLPPFGYRIESGAVGLVTVWGRQLPTDQDTDSQGPTLCPNLQTPSPNPGLSIRQRATQGQNLCKIRSSYECL